MSLQKLLKNESLDQNESFQLFDEILNNVYSDIEISSILTSLKIKNESVAEITGAVNALLNNAKKVDLQSPEITDTCGTGGDGFNTFNISTLSSIVSASMGIPIVKHGNRSVSSKCGSADILEKTGYNITNPNVSKIFNQSGFTFLFAPLFHQGVKNVMNVRQTLKTRTIFNILGPLINPAPVSRQLLGVYDPNLSEKMIQVLQALGRKKAIVCHGSGLDEIAIHDKTNGFFLANNTIAAFTLDPLSLFKEHFQISDISLDSVDDNIRIFNSVLNGNADKAFLYAVAINAAVILFLNDQVQSIKEGFEKVLTHLKSQKAYEFYQNICEISHDS